MSPSTPRRGEQLASKMSDDRRSQTRIVVGHIVTLVYTLLYLSQRPIFRSFKGNGLSDLQFATIICSHFAKYSFT